MTRARTIADYGNGITADEVDLGQLGGRRNLVINGAMQVAQRGTSATGVSSGSAYRTVDRLKNVQDSAGTWTFEQSTDAPNGFKNSWKATCTTANASLGSGSYFVHYYNIEGQDVQRLAYGSSDAKYLTLSFWVKSNKTGTYQVNTRVYSSGVNDVIGDTYTVNSADTWEYKTITVQPNTSNVIYDDNTTGMQLEFWYAAGSGFTSGAVPTSWEAIVSSDRAAGLAVNLADATSNYIAMTGLQLEVGSVATPFEHRSYGEELALCKRYYQGLQGMHLIGNAGGTTVSGSMHFPEMRATPSFSQTGVLLITDPGVVDKAQSSTSVSIVAGRASVKAAQLGFGNFSGITQRYIYSDNISNATGQVVLDAEL